MILTKISRSNFCVKKIKKIIIKSFRILKRVKRLIHKLKLLINMKIYDIIFIIYLELATHSVENLYLRY